MENENTYNGSTLVSQGIIGVTPEINSFVYGSSVAPQSGEGMNQEERPMNQKIRSINISQMDSGYVITIGCQTIATGSLKKLLKNLKMYMENPYKFESEWMNGDKKLR